MTETSIIRLAGILFTQLVAAGCEVHMRHVTLEAARFLDRPSSVIRGETTKKDTETFIEFKISSDQDLLEFGKRWKLQAHCDLENEAHRDLGSPVWGPFHNGYDVSRPWRLPTSFTMAKRADGRFDYYLYAFPNLTAYEFREHGWFPEPVTKVQFSQVHCYLIGVKMAWLIFPRSNEWTMTRSELLELLPDIDAGGAGSCALW